MQKITVLSGQSLFDIAIQYTGDVINAYAIAFANNIEVTQTLNSSEVLFIPDGLITAKKELTYLTGLAIVPATGITLAQDEVFNPSVGIGTMIIESTFIVG